MHYLLNINKLFTLQNTLPNLSPLQTIQVQEFSLQELRKNTITILYQTNSIYLNLHYIKSFVEQTIDKYNPYNIPSLIRPLLKKNYRKIYPKNLANKYISRYSDRFFGCLYCGSIDKQFKQSKSNKNCEVRLIFSIKFERMSWIFTTTYFFSSQNNTNSHYSPTILTPEMKSEYA